MTASTLCDMALKNGMDTKAAMSFDWQSMARDIRKENEENLTIFALRMRNDLYSGGGMGRHDFDINFLSGLGEHERQLAKREGIDLDGFPL